MTQTFDRCPGDGDNDRCDVIGTYGNDEREQEFVMTSGRRIDMETWIVERRADYPQEQAFFHIVTLEHKP